MKTIQPLFFAAILILLFFSCRKKDNNSPEQEKEVLLTKISTSSTTTSYEYDGQRRAVKSKVAYAASPVNDYTSTYAYNDKDQLTEWYIDPEDPARDATRIIMTYNSGGQMVMSESYTVNSSTATLAVKLIATYSQGKIAINQTDYPAGTSHLEVEYFTDAKGNLTKQISHRPDGSEWITTEYLEYDHHPASGSSLPQTTFYKNANNYLSAKSTDHETGGVSNSTYSYEYNDKGYPVKRTISGSGAITAYEYIFQ